MNLPSLRLNPKADRRLRAGHVWIYSNEINIKQTPLTAFTPGQAVNVMSAEGKCLGSAYVNPHTLLAARLYSLNENQMLDVPFLVWRLTRALEMRQRLFEKPFYRLVYGESDGLPGLVVDRFNDVLVVQTATAGMECALDNIIEALTNVIGPTSIILKNDSGARAAEGLESYQKVVLGEAPETLSIEENEVHFLAPLANGQKTGWFYDHRLNRARMTTYVKNKTVLDVFSYVGGWGVQAAVAGAAQVTCVDASQLALDYVKRNAALNKVDDKIDVLLGDAFEVLKKLIEQKKQFDVIVLDPPAFIKRKKDIENGKIAYKRINDMALRLLSKEGILISASCSMHLAQDDLINMVRIAGREQAKFTQMIEQGHQGPDHPIHLAIPETAYLKSIMIRSVSGE
jgi:23S rRNA (cytosine1962-C5)-methyltransferase